LALDRRVGPSDLLAMTAEQAIPTRFIPLWRASKTALQNRFEPGVRHAPRAPPARLSATSGPVGEGQDFRAIHPPFTITLP
jgi:hypothetical protein